MTLTRLTWEMPLTWIEVEGTETPTDGELCRKHLADIAVIEEVTSDPLKEKFLYLQRADADIQNGRFPVETFPEYRRVVSVDMINACLAQIRESSRLIEYLIVVAMRQRAILLQTPGTYCCRIAGQQLRELEMMATK